MATIQGSCETRLEVPNLRGEGIADRRITANATDLSLRDHSEERLRAQPHQRLLTRLLSSFKYPGDRQRSEIPARKLTDHMLGQLRLLTEADEQAHRAGHKHHAAQSPRDLLADGVLRTIGRRAPCRIALPQRRHGGLELRTLPGREQQGRGHSDHHRPANRLCEPQRSPISGDRRHSEHPACGERPREHHPCRVSTRQFQRTHESVRRTQRLLKAAIDFPALQTKRGDHRHDQHPQQGPAVMQHEREGLLQEHDRERHTQTPTARQTRRCATSKAFVHPLGIQRFVHRVDPSRGEFRSRGRAIVAPT